MGIATRVLTAEEARNTMNGVGLERAYWDGSSFGLILLDGTAIEIKGVNNTGEGEVEKSQPSLSFNQQVLRIKEPIDKY